MNIVIISKDQEAVKVLKCCLMGREDLSSINVFAEPEEALDYLWSSNAHLIFLDWEGGGMSMSEWLQKIPQKVSVIMLSDQPKDAVEAFDLQMLDFMAKPLSIARCNKSIQKFKPILEKRRENPLEVFFIKVNNQILKLRFDDIFFIEADGDYVSIHTAKTKYVVNMGLGVMEEILKHKPFARVHRSFIIAIDKIERIVDNKVLINTIKVPLGNSYKNDFLAKLNVLY